MAGRMTSVSPSPTWVASPSRTRTSSSLRYTLTYRLRSPPSPKSCPRVSGCASARPVRTSPTVAPSALTSRSPPTDGRRTGGMRIVAIALTLARGGAERLVVGEHAHLLVADRVGLAGADRALRVAADLELRRRGAERVVDQQPADERVALAGDQLDDLGRLEQAHR